MVRNKAIYIRWAEKSHVDVIPCEVVEVSATMLTMKGWVIFVTYITTAVNLIIVPDLHQMNAGLRTALLAERVLRS